MTKVLVSKEVAEAIEELRDIGLTDFSIANSVGYKQGFGSAGLNKYLRIIDAWLKDGGGHTHDALMQALVNGYEVEKPPEDSVFEYFNRMRMRRNGLLFGYEREQLETRMQTVQETLDILGIKIEGINNYAQNTDKF